MQLLREICQVAYHLGCQQLRSRIVERQSTWEGGPNEHAGVGWKWCTRRIGEGRGVMRALAGACAVRRRRCRLTLHLATVRAWEATTSELSHTKSRPEHRAAPCARGHHRASAQHSQHGGVPDRAQPPGYCVPSCRNLVTAGRPSFSQGPKRAPQKQLASEQKGTAARRKSCVYNPHYDTVDRC